MTLKAVVLAGSRGAADPVAAHAGVPEKALAEIGGRTMLARVVGALHEAGIDEIAVSAGHPAVRAEAERLGAQCLGAAPGPSGSTAAALTALGTPLLVVTADHAMLRPEWAEDFIANVPSDADAAVLLAKRQAVERAAPGSRRTYLRFADGDWSGCNLFYLATPKAAGLIAFWSRIERDRKRPWRIVRMLGPRLLLRYLAGRLTLAEAVARLGALTGAAAAIVECKDGMAAVDVDRPADLDLVRSLHRC